MCSTSTCHWWHPSLPNMPTIQQPASKRKPLQKFAVILFYSSKETKPSLDGDVKVLLQCLEQQMYVYAEKSGMNRREELLTPLVTLSIPAGMLVTKETTEVKKPTTSHRGAHTWAKAVTLGFYLRCGCTSANKCSGSRLCCIHI